MVLPGATGADLVLEAGIHGDEVDVGHVAESTRSSPVAMICAWSGSKPACSASQFVSP